tara:strand:- start:4890 stop:5156 length:267 start_codon:yes stop_codon:yes gene_type:complete
LSANGDEPSYDDLIYGGGGDDTINGDVVGSVLADGASSATSTAQHDDLRPKYPPSSRESLLVKLMALSCQFAHPHFLCKSLWCQISQE